MRSTLFALTLGIVSICANAGHATAAEVTERPAAEVERPHSIELSPLSPLFRIYGAFYSYALTPKNELVFGLMYMNIKKEHGETHSPALVLGFRRFIWRNLHVEYQLWPGYDHYYESDEDQYYDSFDLWNEARIGYRFELELDEVTVFANIQWLFGFGLYASNKPDSFKREEEKNRFFTSPVANVGLSF